MTPLVPQNFEDTGESTETNKSIQWVVGVRRGGATFQPEDGGTHRTGSIARRGQLSLEVAERGTFGESAQNKVIETAFRLEQAMEKMSLITKLLDVNLEPAGLKTGLKKRLLGGIKKTKTLWEKWYETIDEEEKLESNKVVTVQCIDFCEVATSDVHAVLRHAPADLRGGTLLQQPRVLVATVAYQENPPLCLQILHAARFQVFRGAYILLRVLADTKSQEAQGLLEEIRRQSGVLVLSGHATVFTNVATASVFFADLRKMKISQKTRQHRMTWKVKQNSPCPNHCIHGGRIRRFMKIWDTHQIERWCEYYVSVEPSAGSRGTETSSRSHRESLAHFLCVQRRCRT